MDFFNKVITFKLLLIGGLLHTSDAALCSETANRFDRYASGACPTGTTWDKSLECCTGCPVCGPGFRKGPECKGPCQQCPVNFYSDKYDNSECLPCTVCEDFKRTTKSQCFPNRNAICGEYLEGFAPSKGSCNNDLNQFDRYASGACPTGTSWKVSLGCCTGCPVCAPGFRKAPNCQGPCQPCPVNFYSSDYDNSECHPCTVCTDLKRTKKAQCFPTRDATCGDCIEGFWEHPGLLSRPERFHVSCLGCPQVLPSGNDVGEACSLAASARTKREFDPKLTLRIKDLRIKKFHHRPDETLPRRVNRMVRKLLQPRNITFSHAEWLGQDLVKIQFKSEQDMKNVLEHADEVKSRHGKTIIMDTEV